MSTPTTEPAKITAGDSIEWIRKSSDCLDYAGNECKPADFSLQYVLVKPDKRLSINALDGAQPDEYLISLATTVTINYPAGFYDWQAYVTEKAGSNRYTVGSGSIEILPNFQATTSGYDNLSHIDKVLEAINATIEKRADKDQMTMVVAGEEVAKHPIHRLIELKKQYEIWRAQAETADRIAQGLGHKQNIYIRFGGNG